MPPLVPPPFHSVTKRLWQQRYRWTEERLAAAAPRDPEAAAQQGKPPARVRVAYSFAADPITREHYRNPWGEARIGRLLEDLDSLAGYVAFAHRCFILLVCIHARRSAGRAHVQPNACSMCLQPGGGRRRAGCQAPTTPRPRRSAPSRAATTATPPRGRRCWSRPPWRRSSCAAGA